MMDKKELNMMELDMVPGGSWIGDVVDFVEDAAEDVWDGTLPFCLSFCANDSGIRKGKSNRLPHPLHGK